MEDSSLRLTRLLAEVGARPAAVEELLPLVYEELRGLAERQFRNEAKAHTLQPTALVHEAFLKLVGGADVAWESRGHFFRVAAEAMRRILIDHARKRGSQKRGGGRPLSLSVADPLALEQLEDVLALDDALQVLAREDRDAAEVVRFRFYGGLDVAETAAALQVSERTVMRNWAFARVRLFEMLGGTSAEEPA